MTLAARTVIFCASRYGIWHFFFEITDNKTLANNSLHFFDFISEPVMTQAPSESPNSNTIPEIEPVKPDPRPSYIIGIGASAGGLEALEKLVAGLDVDSSAAFVIIQHLSPDYKSMMDTLLARHTRMPIVVVQDNMPLVANRIHLIPPGSLMRIEGERLRLTPKEPRVTTLPVDVFFQSAAREWGNRSVGVILSGTGSDGSRGLLAINEAGGLSIAQEPSEAAFDGMPRSAISTGLVDEVLPVEAIPGRLMAHVFREPGTPASAIMHKHLETADAPNRPDAALAGILHVLHQLGGIDFREYKPATVLRRIERRMAVRQVTSMLAYLDLLSQDRAEALVLNHELLIPVTSFFRDTDTFDVLYGEVIEPLVMKHDSGQSIRVWCAGVSTGEEAYSIAMLFLEAFEKLKRWPTLKIFATDVDQINIDSAGAGGYPESIETEITPERLSRFFHKRGNRYIVKTELRQTIVFARHNLLSDPPFTKMDLVVCRNALIYLRPPAQLTALRRLHYSLVANGFLFLGPSESLGDLQADFKPLHGGVKIWQAIRQSTSPMVLNRYGGNPLRGDRLPARTSAARPVRLSKNAVELGFESLLRRFGPPPAVLVNHASELVHVYGDVSHYLRIRDGQVSLDVTRMLLEPLVPIASALFFKCARDGSAVSSNTIRIPARQGQRSDLPAYELVRLSAMPGGELDGVQHILLVFESINIDSAAELGTSMDIPQETAERIEVLENELAMTRDSLQATIEALETANEELQATNEEMMASNEELQSSNEELQSVNEELNTVNAEYQEKIEILNRINADLDSLTKVVETSTLFVDDELILVRFSEEAAGIFRLREGDLGRPLEDLNHSLEYPDLIDDLTKTLASGTLLEKEVSSSQEDRRFMVRMLPYNIPSTAARGLVISLIEITEQHRAVQRLHDIIDALPENIAVLDESGMVITTNRIWADLAGAGVAVSNRGDNYLRACRQAAQTDPTARREYEGIDKVLCGQAEHFCMERAVESAGATRWFLINANRLGGHRPGAIISYLEITDIKSGQPAKDPAK